MSECRVKSVESVVIDILSHHHDALSATDLFVLCTRFFREHVLPGTAGEGANCMPPELHSLDTFTDCLRTLMSGTLRISGFANDCEVRLKSRGPQPENFTVVTRSWSRDAIPRPQHPPEVSDPSDDSGNSSNNFYHDFDVGSVTISGAERSEARAPFPLQMERLGELRQRICECLVDHVLTECRCQSISSALPIGELRQRCMQSLVRSYPTAGCLVKACQSPVQVARPADCTHPALDLRMGLHGIFKF
jgi:hypothetical protein